MEIGRYLDARNKHIIVIKSTVPVGTSRRVSYIINREFEKRKINIGSKIIYSSNPEFLREGIVIKDMLYPDRVVIGTEKIEDLKWLLCLYKEILTQSFMPPPFLPRPNLFKLPRLIITDPTAAELIKYAANAFLAM